MASVRHNRRRRSSRARASAPGRRRPGSLREWVQERFDEIERLKRDPVRRRIDREFAKLEKRVTWTPEDLVQCLRDFYPRLGSQPDWRKRLLASEHLHRCVEGFIVEIGPVGPAALSRVFYLFEIFQYFVPLLDGGADKTPYDLLAQRDAARARAEDSICDLRRVTARHPAYDKQLQPIIRDLDEALRFVKAISAPIEDLLNMRGRRGKVRVDARGAWRGLLVRAFDSVVSLNTENRAATIAGLVTMLGLGSTPNQVGALLRRIKRETLDPLALLRKA